jgi:hypothetical protein
MMSNCWHEKTVCPEHKGSFDCNPFCAKCEGEQEFCFPCDEKEQFENTVRSIIDHLTDINAHTLARMLDYQIFGSENELEDEVMCRTYEVAKNFLYSFDQELLGRK